RRLQVSSAGGIIPVANEAKAAAEPRIAQCAVESDRCVEASSRRADAIFRRQQEALQRVRLRIARRELQRMFGVLERPWRAAKRELQLREPRPGETTLR